MQVQRYSGIAVTLHWLVAAGIVANVVLAWIWPHLADASVRPAIDTHKSIGITVLGLAVMRLLWRLTHRPPPLDPQMPTGERHAAYTVHWLLYLVIFAMPLTGWIMDSAWKDAATHPMQLFGIVPWPRIGAVMHMAPGPRDHVHDLFGAAHYWFSWVIYGLFALHVAGALKHQWLDHRPELQRMWFGRSRLGG